MPDSNTLRGLLPAVLVLVLTALLGLLVYLVSRDPIILEVAPRTVESGEEVVVQGDHFGQDIDSLLVGGRRVPTSSILEWSDQQIRFRVPSEVGSGLIVVQTERGRSEGELLQIRDRLPQARAGRVIGSPVIASIDISDPVIGGLVTLSGRGFGTVRRSSEVVFSTAGDTTCSCPEFLAYAEWSSERIVVRVPDYAVAGEIFVRTPAGSSNSIPYTISQPAGRLERGEPSEIAVTYGVNLNSVSFVDDRQYVGGQGHRDILVRVPHPPLSDFQTDVRFIKDSSTEFLFEEVGAAFSREIKRTVMVRRYAVEAAIAAEAVPQVYERQTPFYQYYTRDLPGLDLESSQIKEAATTARRAGNPYAVARRAYDIVIDRLTPVLGRSDRGAAVALETGVGDDLSYAHVFTAILRSAGVPARTVGGVAVGTDRQTFPHFWAEFFVPSVGWVPADPAYGDSAFPASFAPPSDPREFYFANLDADRVAFQRGYDDYAPVAIGGPEWGPADPIALRRTHVRAGIGIEGFSVEWLVPRTVGIF